MSESSSTPSPSPPRPKAGLRLKTAAAVLTGALAAASAAAPTAHPLDLLAQHNRRALELVERGNLEEAVAEWREALRLAPDNVPVHLNLGIVLLKLGRIEEAVEVLSEAVRLDYQRAGAHYYLGRAYLHQGKMRLAETELTTAQKLDPADPAIDVALAVLAMQRRQYGAAESHLQRALSFRYNDPDTHAALGDVYRAMGNWPKAEKAYRAALSLDAFHLGAKRGLAEMEKEQRQALAPPKERRQAGALKVADPVTRIERGRYVVEGHVVNTSERVTAKYVTILCQFYDKHQRILTEEETHTEPESLGPGERGSWRLSVPYSPDLAGHFEIGVKAIMEDPEVERAGRAPGRRAAGPPSARRPTFFDGDEVKPGDVLKVSIPKPSSREDKRLLRGYIVNVGDRTVASIDLIIRLYDRKSGRLHSQQFAEVDRKMLAPGERTDYTLEWEEGLDPDRFRPNMAISWAELPRPLSGRPAPRAPKAEEPAPGPPRQRRLPTPIPEPLPTRPRN